MKTTIILLILTIPLISVNCLADKIDDRTARDEVFLSNTQECGYENYVDWYENSATGEYCFSETSVEECVSEMKDLNGCIAITKEEFNKQYEEVIE